MELLDIFGEDYDNINQLNLFPHIRQRFYEANKDLLNAVVYNKLATPLIDKDERDESGLYEQSYENGDGKPIYTMKERKKLSCMSYDELKFLTEYLIDFTHNKFKPYARAFIEANPDADAITIDMNNLKFKNAKKGSICYIKFYTTNIAAGTMGMFSISELCLRYLWCNAICRLEYYLSFDQFEKASVADKKIKKVEKMIDELELDAQEYYESIANMNQ